MLVPSTSSEQTVSLVITSTICNRLHSAQTHNLDHPNLFLYHWFVIAFLHSSFLKSNREIFGSLVSLSSSLRLFLPLFRWVWMHSCSQWYWVWISVAVFSFTALMFDRLPVFLYTMVCSCDWTLRDNHRDFVQSFICWSRLGSLVAQPLPVPEPPQSCPGIPVLYSIQESFADPL